MSKEKDMELNEETYRAMYYLQKYQGFRYIEPICAGGYGNVGAMFDAKSNRAVAVKCTVDPGNIELERWRTFKHDNVVPLLKIFMMDCCVAFVMPLYKTDMWSICETDSFYDDILSYDLCRVWFKDILHGLAYFHEMGLAHLDVKLDNCFISQNGHACLGDFSLMTQKTKVSFSNPFLEHFQPPEFTPAYEEITGQEPTQQLLRGDYADMWEFGILVIDMVMDRVITVEKTSSYEIWKYDIFPFIQKITDNQEFVHHRLRKKFRSRSFNTTDASTLHSFLVHTLKNIPTQRMTAENASCHPFVDVEWPKTLRPETGTPILKEERQGVAYTNKA